MDEYVGLPEDHPESYHTFMWEGWNKVLLKLPIGKFGMDETRLVKWMFTTVFVTPDGEKAVEGLIYSPEKQL